MVITQREETIWNMIWLLVGVPVMIAGLIVGVHFDDVGLQVGTSLDIALVLLVTRDTILPLLERTMMFGRHKKDPKSVVMLDVVAVADRSRIGVLEVVRGRFQQGDTLRIEEIYPTRGGVEEMTVKILKNGHVYSAGTLRVRNGNFEPQRRLNVEAINSVPAS